MRWWTVLALVPALTACPSAPVERADPAAEPPIEGAAPPVPSTPLERSEHVAVVGIYAHPSGLEFPATAGRFDRTDVSRFDREGNDVGVHYRRSWIDAEAMFRAEVTLFAFPTRRGKDGAELPIEVQLRQEIAEARSKHPSLKPLRSRESTASYRGRTVRVLAAEFGFEGGPALAGQPMVGVIVAFLDGTWHFTYRMDCPPPRRDVCVAALESLVAAIGLPPTGLPAKTE